MAKTSALKLVACLAVWASATAAQAQTPKVEDILRFKPAHDVQISTPTPDEFASCEVKLIKGSRPGSTGWLLVDKKKNQTMRRFFANGGKFPDVYAYYKDGVEVYRELDSNGNQKIDQYRWFNTGGLKWGVSSKEDGKIDSWRLISAEEASQEIFQALAANDFARMEALFISEAEMRALKLPATEVDRIQKQLKGASAKFQTTLAKLPSLKVGKFVRVESQTPSCIPAESFGGEQDLIKFPTRQILFEIAGKDQHEWVMTGEMIQVGLSWRLLDGPSPQEQPGNPQVPVANENKEYQKALADLNAVDNEAPKEGANNQAIATYNQKRVAVLERLLQHSKAEDREGWYKQIFDNLMAAAQADNEPSSKRLTQYREDLEKKMAGSNLAGYCRYRELWATYGRQLVNPKADQKKVQEEWHDQLGKFVQAYPKADDTADALEQLAMGAEFAGKDEEAKRWYQQLYKTFPEHRLAEKARGAERRLSSVGRPFELTAPQLAGGAMFNINQLKDKKFVAVYYFASHVDVCARDLEMLKKLQSTYAKDLEVVCVSLDDKADDASKCIQKAQIAGVQVFQPGKEGGLSSPLAVHYGIIGLPHMFFIGRDGNVINHNVQAADLEAELKKKL